MCINLHKKTRLGIGPGGIHCSCCTDAPYKNGPGVKTFYNRKFRKLDRVQIQKEVDQSLFDQEALSCDSGMDDVFEFEFLPHSLKSKLTSNLDFIKLWQRD